MKYGLIILFVFTFIPSHAQFYKLLDHYDSVTQLKHTYEPHQQDSQYVFKGVNSTLQKLEIRFKNISTWDNAHLQFSTLLSILNDINSIYSDSVLSATSGKSFQAYVIDNNNVLYQYKESPSQDKNYVQIDKSIHPVKLTQDTIHIFREYTDQKNNKSVVNYTFIVNDALNINATELEEFGPFIDSIHSTIQYYKQKWNRPDSRSKKIVGIYAENNFESKNLSFSHGILNRFFLESSPGIYAGVNAQPQFILETTVGFKPLQNSFYIGLSNGFMFSKLNPEKMVTNGFMAIEFGTVYSHSSNPTFFQGNRVSFALGIYNYDISPDKSIYNKPSFYMGINLPLTNVFQFGIHMAADFKGENADPNKNLFGISMRCSLGGLFNQYSM